jgi:hypothetical protein
MRVRITKNVSMPKEFIKGYMDNARIPSNKAFWKSQKINKFVFVRGKTKTVEYL